MKIVRAMKKVSRLQGEIKELKHRIQRSLSVLDENDYSVGYKEVTETLNERRQELMRLKIAIMHTNVKNGMFRVVLELGEMKAHIVYLREFNIRDGLVMNEGYGSSDKTKYKSQISEAQKNAMLQETQQRINDLTDSLDDFNAKTDIEETGVTVRPFP